MKQVPRNKASRKISFLEVLEYLYTSQCVTFVLTKQQITLRLRKEGVTFDLKIYLDLPVISN